MNQTLLLEGFLQPYEGGLTYTRIYPESGLMVGLGWFPPPVKNQLNQAAWCPPRKGEKAQLVFRNTVESKITDLYLTMRGQENWQENLIGQLGWFTRADDRGLLEASVFRTLDTFDEYPLVERAFLNDFPTDCDPTEWLLAVRRVFAQKEATSTEALWAKALKAARLGVPATDFADYVWRLPEETLLSVWG